MNLMKKTLLSLGVAAGVLFSSVGGASAATVHYKDVKSTDNYYHAVENLLEQKAISLTLENFRPNENITRGQASSILAKVLGLDIRNGKNQKFKDVSTDNQFYPYIMALENAGLIGGKSDGTFGVNDPLTRGQMAGILAKAYDIPLVGVQNVKSLKYADVIENNSRFTPFVLGDIFLHIEDYKFKGQWGQQIATMNYFGFMGGYDDGNFKPNTPIKRSQFANMLYKIESKDINKRYAFVDYKKVEELVLGDRYGYSTYAQIEDKSVLEYKDTISGDTSEYCSYDPVLESDCQALSFLDYVIYEPKKEGVTSLNGSDVKIVVSKDSKGNWKLDFKKVMKEAEPTTEDTATAVE